ncbi:MAG: hypothetical protein HY264_10985, partial [Chloroflexi bacterium]|nr:hypothetical protein [Chloroflexota bacterium]
WPTGFSRAGLPAGCANVGSGPDFTCALGTIVAGGNAGFSISYTVPSTTDSGDQANTATATSSTFDPITPNTATDHTSVTESVSLHVTKTFTDLNVTAGTSGHTFTIAVNNSGPSDADHVHIIDNLPSRIVATGVSSSGFTCTFTSALVDCTRPHLDSTDGTLAITVTYTASSGPEALNVSNTADVTSDEVTTAVTGTGTVNIVKRTTATAVVCLPSGVVINDVTTCTATVSDTDTGTKVAPIGTVAWTRSAPVGATGTFGSSTCSLSQIGATTTSSCSVTYTPNSVAGTHTLKASYSGSGFHATSDGYGTVTASLRATTTLITCSPVVVSVGTAITCTATVADVEANGTKTSPLGTVTFNTDNPSGVFTPSSRTCNLVPAAIPTSTCSVTYKSSIANVDNITATYTPTDNVHSGSSTTIATIVVTYDPSGGFVTGGGYILQPARNTYPSGIGVGAKNNYGFNAKYKNGATVPTGELEFQFKPGNINFHGSSFDWLVITTLSSTTIKAQAQGSGTNNGTGSYGFLVTVIDGGSNDTFRIKIWDKTTMAILYDNEYGSADNSLPSTVAAGGNIVVHAK